MNIYSFLMIVQVVCLVLVIGCLTFFYMEKKTKYRDPLVLTLVMALCIVGGYALFLQTTGYEGLLVAQKIYRLGKVAAPLALLYTYLSITKTETQLVRYRWYQMVSIIICAAAMVFVVTDSLQNYLFTDQAFMQNQYFYYIEETGTGLTLLFEIYQIVILIMCSILVMKCRLSEQGEKDTDRQQCIKFKVKKLILSIIPLLQIAAFGASHLSVVRQYDLVSITVTLGALMLVMVLPLSHQTGGE